jgi:hypothetical protein
MPVLRVVELTRSAAGAVCGRQLLSRGIEDGSVRPDISPELEATVAVAMLRGVGYQWRLDPKQVDPVRALEHVTELLRERWRTAPRGSS